MFEFLAWAMYTKQPLEFSSDERRETNAMIDKFESRFGYQLPDGYDPEVRAIRLNFDPVTVWHTGLGFNLFLWAVHAATTRSMKVLGFTRKTGKNGIVFFHCENTLADCGD